MTSNPMRLARNDLLARTPQGTREMSARSSDLSPKLRSVLFLMNGRSAAGELLEQAGALANVLEGQIMTLMEMGLVEVSGLKPPPLPLPAEPPELPPVAGAKIALLKSLEATGSFEAPLLAEELLDARTLRELAVRARDIAYRLRDADGQAMADGFWSEAKRILVTWRDLAANAGR